MSTIIVDDAMREQLRAARGEPVELRDHEGNQLAFVMWLDTGLGKRPHGMTDEELDRLCPTQDEIDLARSSKGRKRTMAEVLRHFEAI